MITGLAVSVLLLHHHRRVAGRRAVNHDYAGALPRNRDLPPCREGNPLENTGACSTRNMGPVSTHYAVRAFMSEAADTVEMDPDRLSFTRTLHILRRRITDPAVFSPQSPTTTT